MNQILLASKNKDKLIELKKAVAPFNLEVKTLENLGIDAPEETGKNFEENALLKAHAAFKATGLPTIADDSGFCIAGLNDFPGLVSKRFAQITGGYDKAASILYSCLEKNKQAYFTTCIAFVFEKGGKIFEKTFFGNIEGTFVYPGRGENGFGYCPYFVPNGYDLTFAELPNEHRTQINHRSMALNKFANFLKENF